MPVCKIANCEANSGGKCLEGQGANCPNLIALSEKAEVSGASPEILPEAVAREDLYRGLKLSTVEASELLRSERAHVVVIAGPVDSGKTTLLCKIMEMFQVGPIKDHRFAGSQTLPAFESLCWHNTFESGANAPIVPRTPRSDNEQFFHIQVQNVKGDSIVLDLLIGDLAGETFPEVATDESICRAIVSLARADHLLIAIDGEAIRNPGRRHEQQNYIREFIRRVIQTGQVGRHTALHLVTTKIDVLGLGDEGDSGLSFLDHLENRLTADFMRLCGSIHCWRTAARPHNGTATEDAIGELMNVVASTTHRYEYAPPAIKAEKIAARDFSQFGSHYGI